jgi:tRNA(Ile)-lysidine synthase
MVPSANNTPLNPDFSQLPQAKRYVLAFSGGMDSTALLYCLSQDKRFQHSLSAIHVNHGIHQDADHWARHCQHQCDRLNIPLHIARVTLDNHSEACARNARIEVFRKQLNDDDCLLTAHHQDDQLETLLFRLMRGTGLKGLTGMAKLSTHEPYPIYRPLLSCNRSDIQQWVTEQQLTYVDDPSNQEDQYSRNFIRNQLLPLMHKGNQQVRRNLSLTLTHLQDSEQLLEHLVGQQNPINIDSIKNSGTFTTYLYHWLNALNIESPSHKRLRQYALDCQRSQGDKQPRMQFGRHLLWLWKSKLYCLDADYFRQPLNEQTLTLKSDSISLSDGMGTLTLGGQCDTPLPVVIRYCKSQEKIRLNNHTNRKTIKKLFQEDGIAPWYRQVQPYVYFKEQLVAVGNLYMDTDFGHKLKSINAEFSWQPPAFLR